MKGHALRVYIDSKSQKQVFLNRIISLSQMEDTVKISRTRIHTLFTVRVELYQQDSVLQNSGKRPRGSEVHIKIIYR